MRVLSTAVTTLALAISTAALGQEQREIGAGSLPPIQRDYKARISSWARQFFVAPRAVTGATISDPILVRDGTGRLLWLVCVEATNTAPTARLPGPDRYAFGFAPNYFTAPVERRGATILRTDCDERQLVWRPFPGFARS
jgi:hypothetical protein